MLRKTCVALAVLGLGSLASQEASAAVTVLGNGDAQVCFEAAEFGGNPEDGIKACTTSLDEQELALHDRAATLINRGILYSRADQPATAIKDYDQGLKVDSTLAEGYVDRGAALIVLRRYEAALVDINKGIEMGANRPQIAYYDRAIVHEALGDVRAAYEDYKKAAELEPGFALANAQLARFRIVHHESDDTE